MTDAATAELPASEVAAACGTVRGRLEDGVHVFRGIPYALPPVGPRRFAPPVDAAPVESIDATRFGPIALQDIDPLPEALPGAEHNFYALDAVTSEDCLNLNVWTPDPSGSAPVYVYVHGGAFLYGSGTGAWTDGHQHAREHGIVVVTINYRLGLLGGLWLGDHEADASNLGLLDQVAALRWVQRNIAAFGGDPDLVTIGGQSAGGMSVAGLLCTPSARGLFRRAIVESGHLAASPTVEGARATTRAVLEALHIDPDAEDVLERLRALSTMRLLSVQRAFGIAIRAFPLVLDGVTIAADVAGALHGIAPEIDLLVGTTSEENRLFVLTGWADPPKRAAEAVAALLPDGDRRRAGTALYEQLAAEQALDDEAIDHLIVTEHGWATPARQLAVEHASAGGRTFHYEFAWRSSVPGVGAAHLVDLPFFMGNLDAPGVPELLGDEVRTEPATRALADGLSAAVAQFVRTGDLSSSPIGAWPPFRVDRRTTMVIDRSSIAIEDRKADRLDFWHAASGSSSQPLSSIGATE